MISIFLAATTVALAQPTESYFDYLKKLGLSNGSYKLGEIEVIIEPVEIAQIQEIQKNRLLRKGYSEAQATEFSRVGIVSEDQYWIWIRDAVYFPKGVPGTYDRLLWKAEGTVGVAVLPILPNGKIVLNLNYRHATRSWELELPRGGCKKGETAEEAAIRELKEETGLEVSAPLHLGDMTPDSGTISSVIPIFLGRVSKLGSSDQEDSEAIADIVSFTKEEIKQGFVAGFLEVILNGIEQKVPLRDSYLSFALVQAEMRKLL